MEASDFSNEHLFRFLLPCESLSIDLVDVKGSQQKDSIELGLELLFIDR